MTKDICRPLSVAFLLLFTAITVSSCASPPPPRAEVDIEQEKFNYNDGSLWPGQNRKNMFFSDNKARSVGDLVTVHVIEKTTAINKASTQDEHSTDNSLTIDTGGASATEMKLGGGIKFKGKGSTGRSDQFSATVSCVVREVLPNGNMRIEGQRRMQINNEEQYIVVRGLIRQDDITYNNTILSSKIADADIMYTGQGGIDSGRQPNWLSRAFGNIWPF
ncbi:MAG TPA: flagellar basal body L-ring protein FlgH [Nitrospirae bacterium]|nr:flagellar basal body L-ring protein FlgH [Nitrospirota bacterium]